MRHVTKRLLYDDYLCTVHVTYGYYGYCEVSYRLGLAGQSSSYSRFDGFVYGVCTITIAQVRSGKCGV
jgi:hypothetical protein